ncbi:MAG: thymidylate synthase [Pseudomonadota bacterium]
MRKIFCIAVLPAYAAGCERSDDGSSADDGSTDAGGGVSTPVSGNSVAVGDVDGVSYDATADTLTVTIALDADTDTATYTAAGQVGTYDRFTQQDEPTDRIFTAFAKTSTDGSITGVAVSDGGQFNRFFGGAQVVQNDYTAPTSGLVSYAGDYVGLLNFGPDGPAVPDPVQPVQSEEVTGTVFLNADFNSSGQVNGAIYDRSGATIGNLPDIVLTATDIDTDGTFSGAAELDDLTGVGSYSGVFGGANATSVGGAIDLEPGFLGEDLGSGTENEYGIFVLDQCPGAGPECLGSE